MTARNRAQPKPTGYNIKCLASLYRRINRFCKDMNGLPIIMRDLCLDEILSLHQTARQDMDDLFR
jgi:hypothetical protein